MKIHYSNSINQKDFTDILNQEFDLDITMKEEQLFSKENVYINYYKHVEFIKHICRKYGCN